MDTVVGAQSYITQYAYDLADRVTQMVYPSGRIVDYGRDALGRVVDAGTRANLLATPVALASGLTWEPFGGIDALAHCPRNSGTPPRNSATAPLSTPRGYTLAST